MRRNEEITKAVTRLKRSHQNTRSGKILFDRFAIIMSNHGNALIVDVDKADMLAHWSWNIDSGGYACSRIGGKLVRMHDAVMAMGKKAKPDGYYVDHINHDKLDNRVENLRFVDPLESSKNIPIKSNNTSGVVGVSQTKSGKFRAYITNNHKQINLGHYDTLEEAAAARLVAETRLGFQARSRSIAFLCEMEKEG